MASSTLPTVTSQPLLSNLLIINHLTRAHSFFIVIAHTMEWVTETDIATRRYRETLPHMMQS